MEQDYGLPQGIQDELTAAIERTGMTSQLARAQHRLPILFNQSPSVVDGFMRVADKSPEAIGPLLDSLINYHLTT